MGLRRYLGRHARFYLACLFTIVAVTYLLVPWIVDLIEAGRAYSPFYYEPKDASRQDFIAKHGLAVAQVSWKTVVNVLLVFAVVIVWFTVLPRGGARKR